MASTSIAKELVEQIARSLPVASWTDLFVCGVEGFGVERALSARFPALQIHAQASGLLSYAVGRLATGASVDVRFRDRLAVIEEALHVATPLERAAGALLAVTLSRYESTNPYAQKHFEHIARNCGAYLEQSRARVTSSADELRLASFTATSTREHARVAVARKVPLLAWVPVNARGDRRSAFLDANVEWERVAEQPFSEEGLAAWIESLEQARATFCVATDRQLPGRRPTLGFFAERARPLFAYTSAPTTSVRRKAVVSEPFRYRVVDPATLSERTTLRVDRTTSARLNFLKDKYLMTGLAHGAGVMQFLVYLDEGLVGGFSYTWPRLTDITELHLLSDFTIAHEKRLAKLVAMVATSREPVRRFDLTFARRTELVRTTVFSERPVSMKYRGVYELAERKPGVLLYESHVRTGTPGDVYRDWWTRFAQNARGAPQARGAEAP